MNRDRLIAFMQKIPVPILFLAVGGWLGWDYYNFKNAEDSPLIAKRNEIEGVVNNTAKLQNDLKQLEKFKAELEGKKADLRALAQRLEETRSNLSETFDDAVFINAINKEAELTRVDLRQINPMGLPTNLEFYAEHRFEIQFRGAYFQLLLFLYRLAVMDTLVAVDSYELRPTGQRFQKFLQLEGRIIVKGYHYLRSRADDISKNPAAASKAPGGAG